ncbi:MAG: hypothetical protein U0527_10205 [Candidatus Eisenbacteria bacterium]
MSRSVPQNAPREAERAWPGALIFVAILLLLRVIFLLAALEPAEDRVADVLGDSRLRWPTGPERPLYDREELYAGAVAVALPMKLDAAVTSFRYMPYGSGSLVISLLAVPLYRALGPTYLSWKLLPLLVTILGGLAWFAVIRRWLGPRMAWTFAALYALAPSTFVRTALIAKGDHAEAMAWIGLVLYLGTRAAQAEGAPGPGVRLRFSIAAGVAAGFGVFLTYSVVPALAGVTAVALLLTRTRPRAAWLGFAAGGLIGLLPWLSTVVRTGGSALEVYGRSLGALDHGAVERLNALVGQGLFAGYDLPGGLLVRQVGALLWLVAVVLGTIVVARRLRQERALLLLVGATAAGILAFVLRAPDASSRYLVPIYPLLLLLASFAPRGLVVTSLLLGVVAQLAVIAGSNWTPLRAPLKGYDWTIFGEVVGQHLSSDALRRAPESLRPHLWHGFGIRLYHELPPEQWSRGAAIAEAESLAVWDGFGSMTSAGRRPPEAAALLRRVPRGAHDAFLHGYLRYAENFWGQSYLVDGISGLGAAARQFSDTDRPLVLESMARSLAVIAAHDARIGTNAVAPPLSSVESILPRDAMAAGAGYAILRGAAPDLRAWRARPGCWVEGELSRDPGSEAVGRGIALALERELDTRSSAWRGWTDASVMERLAASARARAGLSALSREQCAAAIERARARRALDPAAIVGR